MRAHLAAVTALLVTACSPEERCEHRFGTQCAIAFRLLDCSDSACTITTRTGEIRPSSPSTLLAGETLHIAAELPASVTRLTVGASYRVGQSLDYLSPNHLTVSINGDVIKRASLMQDGYPMPPGFSGGPTTISVAVDGFTDAVGARVEVRTVDPTVECEECYKSVPFGSY